jgi:hypothetical protein
MYTETIDNQWRWNVYVKHGMVMVAYIRGHGAHSCREDCRASCLFIMSKILGGEVEIQNGAIVKK